MLHISRCNLFAITTVYCFTTFFMVHLEHIHILIRGENIIDTKDLIRETYLFLELQVLLK